MAVLSPIERAEQELAAMQSAMTAEPDGQQQDPSQGAEQVVDDQRQPESLPQQVDNKDDYYHRWKSLDGMLRKKDEQINELMAQNRELFDRMNVLVSQVAQPQTQQPESPDVIGQLSDEYGSDTVDIVQRILDAKYGQKVSQLESRISELTGMADSVKEIAADQANTRSDTFQAELKAHVGDWRSMMERPEWDSFLESNSEELSGKSYSTIFQEANATYNMNSMVALFNRFKAAHMQKQADPREHLVTPGGSGVGTPASSQPKMWRESDVAEAFDRNRRGLYTPDQWAAIDADIMAAYSEGRISA